MSSRESKFDFNYEILPDNFTKYDISFKLIVIGDSGVGKSCLTTKATRNIFEDAYTATIGFEFFNFNIKIGDKIVKLQIWDTCGQELYRSLITNFYRNSSLAIIVYTVTSRDAFQNVELWLKELRTHSNPNVKVFLIGNKIDLEGQRKVTTEEGQRFYEQNNLNKFMETSAKTGINVLNLFIEAAKLLFDDYLLYHKSDEDYDSNSEVSDKKSNDKSSEPRSTTTGLYSGNEKKSGCCLSK